MNPPGRGILQRIDLSVKLGGMALLSLLLLSPSPYRLLAVGGFAFLLETRNPLPPRRGLFLTLPLLIVFGTSLRGVQGEEIPWEQALGKGILGGSRFFVILHLGRLFTLSTNPLDIPPFFYRFLKIFPFLPRGRISTQLGLSLGMVPLILQESAERKEAMASRGGLRAHRPLRNIVFLVLPLLEGILYRADGLREALSSRSYREDRTFSRVPKGMRGWPLLILGLFTLLLWGTERFLASYPLLAPLLESP